MITGLDHLVLTVADVDRSAAFYERVLGLERISFGAGRTALRFGTQKVNIQPVDGPSPPVARNPMPGSADFCLLTDTPLSGLIEALAREGVPLVEGPVPKIGALGMMTSVYFRDPDGNLVEVARYGGSGPSYGRPPAPRRQ